MALLQTVNLFSDLESHLLLVLLVFSFCLVGIQEQLLPLLWQEGSPVHCLSSPSS